MKTHPSLELEIELCQQGYHHVVGIDEAGRGTWAGPVYAGAVILKPEEETVRLLAGVNDSKKMTEKQRDANFALIQEVALTWGIGNASATEIDQLGIVPATELAMARAVAQLSIQPDYALIDAFFNRQIQLPQKGIVKGDAKSLSIAAASVLAKVARDRYMEELAAQYPGYGFEIHKGYGTVLHMAKLKELGVSPVHRKTFKPIRELLS